MARLKRESISLEKVAFELGIPISLVDKNEIDEATRIHIEFKKPRLVRANQDITRYYGVPFEYALRLVSIKACFIQGGTIYITEDDIYLLIENEMKRRNEENSFKMYKNREKLLRDERISIVIRHLEHSQEDLISRHLTTTKSFKGNTITADIIDQTWKEFIYNKECTHYACILLTRR